MTWISSSQGFIYTELQKEMGEGRRLHPRAISQALWSMIRQGLVYTEFSGEYSKDWTWRLTNAGEAAANDVSTGPDSPNRYFERLTEKVPDASDVVMEYVRESVQSYMNGCYLASSVMIGVASEAAFLEMAQAFANWLPSDKSESLSKSLNNERTGIAARFIDFRNKLHPYQDTELKGLFDNLDVELGGVFGLLRSYRNDAGHPEKRGPIEREDVFDHHRMLVRYLQLLYEMKSYFEQDREQRQSIGPV
jgi:hypothetical protein